MVNSIVEYHAEHESYKCGYCRKPDTNFSHGMWAYMMSVSDYQQLINRGWRRSGKYCYKPKMEMICCPTYTIRCRALEFKLSKSQKKVIKKLNMYLARDPTDTNAISSEGRLSTGSGAEGDEVCEGGGDQFVEAKRQCSDVDMSQLVNEKRVATKVDDGEKKPETLEAKKSDGHDKIIKSGVGIDSSKGHCKKAKQIRLERKMEKLRQKGVNVETIKPKSKNAEKQVEDFIEDIPEEFRNKLEIRLVRTSPPSDEWLSSAKEAHRVYSLYQMAIHGDSASKCSESQFHDFLVSSPLQKEFSEDGPSCGYGSFHQQYWLGSRMIATGVIDILPECISSVYFFYDPQFRFLTLGTYAALREIAFTRELQKSSPKLKYYYMGFYIHTCRKMRYKGNFHPSDLLCPETYTWVPIKDCIPKLELSPYSRLNPDLDAIDGDMCTEKHLDDISLLVDSTVIKFGIYKRLKSETVTKEDVENLLEYAKLVGAKNAGKLILCKEF